MPHHDTKKTFAALIKIAQQISPVRNAVDKALVNKPDIRDSEWSSINQAFCLESGLAAHALLRALGYDHTDTTMGVFADMYELPAAYQKVAIDRKSLVQDASEAKQMAKKFRDSISRHAKILADQVRENQR